ncbi:ELMO domain-containing protein B [Cinnamomum micranthum f. kanehirae]|uniref:ELMO domain-containing protein B n=1 Tax=Cinnamomum micranthum f. kanehirae TaxID=337451 RepID=A0A443NMF6_9MAGN|nr:ELMO domain-containing protein B [Cinnamomum micranthum f. kanehirae]
MRVTNAGAVCGGFFGARDQECWSRVDCVAFGWVGEWVESTGGLGFEDLQERLRNLQQRLEIPFDGFPQTALEVGLSNRDLPSLKSELWKEMGWQGPDPSTDFRGGGFISLENLIFFAKNYPDSFQRLLHKQDGKRAEWEYPFAVAGINISFMLVQMLDLQSGRPTSVAGNRFLELLGEDENGI